nr:MAG TPA: hypothetical protein [Caudoviricetes sp.]
MYIFLLCVGFSTIFPTCNNYLLNLYINNVLSIKYLCFSVR